MRVDVPQAIANGRARRGKGQPPLILPEELEELKKEVTRRTRCGYDPRHPDVAGPMTMAEARYLLEELRVKSRQKRGLQPRAGERMAEVRKPGAKKAHVATVGFNAQTVRK